MNVLGGCLLIGESLIDIVHRSGAVAVEHVGGSPANVALTLARLGTPAELTTWFGTDARGARIREHLTADGVRITPGSDAAVRTSTSHASLDAAGAATYTFDLLWDLPEHGPQSMPGLVHIGSIGATQPPGAEQVAAAVARHRASSLITYDPNTRPDIMGSLAEVRDIISDHVVSADLVKVSDEDLAWLEPGVTVEEVAARWAASGPAVVVVTLGASGALAVTASGLAVRVAAPRAAVVDTVGAGDSFMGGIIDSLRLAGLFDTAVPVARRRAALRDIDETTLRGMLTRAARIAAITVSRAGADPPTAAELADAPGPAEQQGGAAEPQRPMRRSRWA